MGRETVIGSYTGNGSTAVVVDLGFRPAKVEFYNRTDGDVIVHLVDDGASGRAYEIRDSGSGTTDLSRISSNAPTINNRGFSTGTDADLIESAKVFDWIAIK